METDAAIAELRGRLATYDPERFPIQHATARFHLGAALLDAGQPGEAADALRAAVRLFDPLPVERAKALNLLGAAMRLRGDLAAAVDVFRSAAATFEDNDLPRERAAAVFNLGLVLAEQGRRAEAAGCFEQARDHFESEGLAPQAAAAARELGATHLAAGAHESARTAALRAVELADRTGDVHGFGAASNLLGLAHLAVGAEREAVDAFRTAAAAHPRALRPEAYAMAKANLALAYERAGDATRAVLAARQALGIPRPPPGPVAEQATRVVDRLAAVAGTVTDVLDDEPADRWQALLREEAQRWLDATRDERVAVLGDWVDGLLARGERGPDLAFAWLAVLLELPPRAMEALISDTLEALGERDGAAVERFRGHVSRAAIRFHEPQWLRLQETFNRIARERGEDPAWR